MYSNSLPHVRQPKVIIIIRDKMKSHTMRTPVANELLQQKVLYQSHLKKLERIREERKNQLAFDSTRITKHEEIKHAKSRSFAYRYNEQHSEITQCNIKLLDKLEKVKPFTRYTSFSTYEREEREQRTMTPFRRRRIEETEKENSRIFMRMKSVSSSLSKDKLLKDYAKSQQIKTRIARFATQNNRVTLKSEKLVNASGDRSNLVSHYNHQDIIKNKIQNPTEEIKSKRREFQQSQQEEKNAFFATEPTKTKSTRHGTRHFKL